MQQHKVNTPVSASLIYDSVSKKVFPRWIIWRGHTYQITKLGLHHTTRRGNTLYHIFSVVAGDLFLRLIFDTSNLSWVLEEASSAF